MIKRKKITYRALVGKLKSFVLFPYVFADYLSFKKAGGGSRFSLSLIDVQPCPDDNITEIEPERHYTYHPAWAARVLAETKPDSHVDISSTMSFATLVSAFIPMKFYDFRPAKISLDNLECLKADLVNLPFGDNEIKSLSCMHTVEHVGLGRYGDAIDADGDIKAINELKRVLAPGGSLLFVVPLGGRARIQFNAHRIFTYDQIIKYFAGLELKEFALIPDSHQDGDLVRNAAKELAGSQRHACGCFWFIKK